MTNKEVEKWVRDNFCLRHIDQVVIEFEYGTIPSEFTSNSFIEVYKATDYIVNSDRYSIRETEVHVSYTQEDIIVTFFVKSDKTYRKR